MMNEKTSSTRAFLVSVSNFAWAAALVAAVWIFVAEDGDAIFIPCVAVIIMGCVIGMISRGFANDIDEGTNDTAIAIMLYLLYKSYYILVFFIALVIWVVQYFKGNV